MSIGEVHQGPAAGPAQSGRVPLWIIGLSALLIALGFARRRSGDASPVTGDRGSLEVGRGRSAETPSQIPARGWKDILLRVYQGISENRILLVAAGVTFYTLLAIFPGIAALMSIYGLFADPGTVAGHLDTIASVAPGGAVDVLREQMTRLATAASRLALRAVDRLFDLAGAQGLTETNALQRHWRDAHAMAHHYGFNSVAFQNSGRLSLGLGMTPGDGLY